MACYSLKDISKMYGVGYSTAYKHIRKLKINNKFKKTAIGIYYNEIDLKNLSEQLGFSIPNHSISTNNSQK